MREWAGSTAAVFLDFGKDILAWLLPSGSYGAVYIALVARAEFIETHRRTVTQGFDSWLELPNEIGKFESHHRRASLPTPLQLPRNRRRRL
jgi:hypothetical protein